MGADGGAPAVHADAPYSVVLADGGAPAVLAPAPLSVVLADGGAPAVLAVAPPSVVLADGRAPTVLARAPMSVVLADGGAPAVFALGPLSVVLADGRAPARSCDRMLGVHAHAPHDPKTTRLSPAKSLPVVWGPGIKSHVCEVQVLMHWAELQTMDGVQDLS